jgi:aryl-alcohol dehydrogenase-like predicted oxidoreductase
MQYRSLGESGPKVSEIGLGCMGMSGMYGPASGAESLATIGAALDAGVTLLDTGDFYGMGHNELLVGQAIRGRRDEVALSVKFGALRGPDGAWLGFDARPASVKNFLSYSLRRLGVDHIDIYRPARLSPEVPIEETVGAIGELVTAGWVRHVGLSEVGADTIEKAAKTFPICDVQLEYSLFSRRIEEKILPVCRRLGIGVTAYGVLSRGLLSGHWRRERAAAPGDLRAQSPRFSPENLARNLALVEAVRGAAQPRGASVAQAAIAWVLAQGADIVPVIGARTRDQFDEALGGLDLDLTAEDLAAIEKAAPRGAVAGERYPREAMARLDSER